MTGTTKMANVQGTVADSVGVQKRITALVTPGSSSSSRRVAQVDDAQKPSTVKIEYFARAYRSSESRLEEEVRGFCAGQKGVYRRRT